MQRDKRTYQVSMDNVGVVNLLQALEHSECHTLPQGERNRSWHQGEQLSEVAIHLFKHEKKIKEGLVAGRRNHLCKRENLSPTSLVVKWEGL